MARRKRMHGKKRHPSAFKFGMIGGLANMNIRLLEKKLEIAKKTRGVMEGGRKDNIEGNTNPITDAKEENV